MKQSLFFVLPAAESGLQASSPFAMSESRPALASEREERETPREERGRGGSGGVRTRGGRRGGAQEERTGTEKQSQTTQ